MKKLVVFVDGQNFKRSLQDISFNTSANGEDRTYRLDEKHFQWNEVFHEVCRKASEVSKFDYNLLRVYWYNAAKVSNFYIDNWAVKQIVDQYKSRFPELTNQMVIDLAQAWYNKNVIAFNDTRTKIFDAIQKEFDFLEFKYVGQYRLRPFEVHDFSTFNNGNYRYSGTREGEKGVDIGIATDMISKMPNYDGAVLVTNDTDFIPVVNHLKENLKQVFHFIVNHSNMKGIFDSSIVIEKDDMVKRFLKKDAGIPAEVMTIINNTFGK